MKKVCKVVVWLLIVCIFVQLPLMMTRAEEPDMDYEALFLLADEHELEPQDAIRAFFSNPGHFMRALAYHNGIARYYIRGAVNNDMTDSQEDAAYYLIELLATAPYGESLSQSEQTLIDFFLLEHEARRLVAKHGEQKHWPDYKAAILEQMQSDRAAAAENIAAAIVFNNMEFVWNLANESAQMQEQFVSLLGDIEGYYTQLAVIEHLYFLIYSDAGGELPGYPEYTFLPGTTVEQVELILAMLDQLPDVPWPVIRYNPDEQEAEQWHAAPDYPHLEVDYADLFARIEASEEAVQELTKAALLETADFIRAAAQETTQTQQMVLERLVNENTAYGDWNALTEIFKIYAGKTDLTEEEKQFALKAKNHMIVSGGTNRPVSEILEDIIYTTTADRKEMSLQLVYSICKDPVQYAKCMLEMDPELHSKVYYALKWNVDTEMRQVLVDTVFVYLEIDVATYLLTPQEREVLEKMLELQAQSPLSVYPTGQEPPATEPVTLPSSTPTEPTAPLFSTPTKAEPAETDPTAVDSEPEGEAPQKNPPADTGWISTVCIVLGLVCIGIVIATSLSKKKKNQPDPPEPAAEPEPEIPQPEVAVPVVADPNAYCPAPLDKEAQRQIAQALRQKYDEYSIHWYSKEEPDGTCRCYGTDGDCHILFYAGGLRMEISDSCVVGETVFYHGTSFELYAYKDGILTDLNIALEKGMVSPQAVKAALAQHEAIL